MWSPWCDLSETTSIGAPCRAAARSTFGSILLADGRELLVVREHVTTHLALPEAQAAVERLREAVRERPGRASRGSTATVTKASREWCKRPRCRLG